MMSSKSSALRRVAVYLENVAALAFQFDSREMRRVQEIGLWLNNVADGEPVGPMPELLLGDERPGDALREELTDEDLFRIADTMREINDRRGRQPIN